MSSVLKDKRSALLAIALAWVFSLLLVLLLCGAYTKQVEPVEDMQEVCTRKCGDKDQGEKRGCHHEPSGQAFIEEAHRKFIALLEAPRPLHAHLAVIGYRGEGTKAAVFQRNGLPGLSVRIAMAQRVPKAHGAQQTHSKRSNDPPALSLHDRPQDQSRDGKQYPAKDGWDGHTQALHAAVVVSAKDSAGGAAA